MIMGTMREHLSATCHKQRQSRETVRLEFFGFITVSANRSVFVPREQCSADWAFREFSPFLLTAGDIFAPSSSFFIYLSLESIRMIRIIRRISGRTDKPTCTLVATLVVARLQQRVATFDVRALSFQTLDESVLKKENREKIIFSLHICDKVQ